MDPFSGPFCPNKGKYDFLKNIWISQNLASMDVQLPAKLQKKVMEQSCGMTMNVDFDPKMHPFSGPFCPNKGKYEFFEKIWIFQMLASMDVQLSAKLQKKVM